MINLFNFLNLEGSRPPLSEIKSSSPTHPKSQQDHPFYISPNSHPDSPGIVRNTSVPRFEDLRKKEIGINPLLLQSEIADFTNEDQDQLNEFQELHFFCKLTDCIRQVAIEHIKPTGIGPLLSESLATTQQDTFSQDPLHHVSAEQRQCEQMLLYLRSLQVLATALHTVRNKVKAGALKATKCLKTSKFLICSISTH